MPNPLLTQESQNSFVPSFFCTPLEPSQIHLLNDIGVYLEAINEQVYSDSHNVSIDVMEALFEDDVVVNEDSLGNELTLGHVSPIFAPTLYTLVRL